MNRLPRSAPPGVECFGRMPEAQKVDLMKRAPVLLFPAVREGWGLSVIEANAVGTPAIGHVVPDRGRPDGVRLDYRESPAFPYCRKQEDRGALHQIDLLRLGHPSEALDARWRTSWEPIHQL